MDREKLAEMYDEALEKREKELEHTYETVLIQDQRKYSQYINLKGQEFWTLLQELEDFPEWDSRLLQAMRREANRRMLNAKRETESIRTH